MFKFFPSIPKPHVNNRKRIVIIGSGFSGLWSAIGAARKRNELNKNKELEILVISKTNYHGIRPRYYESDIDSTIIPLNKLLDPINVKYILGEITHINPGQKTIILNDIKRIDYDRLVLASGSQLYKPEIPGVDKYTFDVDTYESAKRLKTHFKHSCNKLRENKYTVVVVGGGFTGLEIASELPNHLKQLIKVPIKVIIVDHTGIANTLGEAPQSVILEALKELDIETITSSVKRISKNKLELSNGQVIPTQTVIWTVGMRASPLTDFFPTKKDKLNRLSVNDYLQIIGVNNCFAAGDVAHAMVDEKHASMMSCQHARPQGCYAGHNVVADLYGFAMISYSQPHYVTCLDLGAWGALYMQGWDRKIVTVKQSAKKIKQSINQKRIYPPLTESANDLFEAAKPYIQPLSQTLNEVGNYISKSFTSKN